ncbi:hypothetical protein ACX8Z9_14190 [Arthrobacter halodurans]|uniref:Uncharacterized protein n=1 Tax=Arthrobacter halodurans TaxID=516699 RepID=A0ABV4UTR8_9MICC
MVVDDPEAVDVTWEFALNGRVTSVESGFLKDWNYYSTVSVSCMVSVDVGAVRNELSISEETRLGWVLVARCSGSPVISASRPLDVAGGSQELRMELSGSSLGGVLTVELTMVTLDVPTFVTSPFAPSKLGHVVLSRETRLTLEGSGGQVPILPVSFAGQGITNPSTAMWWLKVMSRDLHASADAVLWLWLNTDNKLLQPLLERPDGDVGTTWMHLLRTDFVRQLLREALASEEIDTSEQYPEGSLGELLTSVVNLIAPSIAVARAKFEEDPGRVETELQAIVNKVAN